MSAAELVEEARARDLPRCTIADLTTADEREAIAFSLREEDRVALTEHLRHFAPPGDCPGCGCRSFLRWGIVHGSQVCEGCGWPWTAKHEVGDLKLWYSLPAHPDEVKAAKR